MLSRKEFLAVSGATLLRGQGRADTFFGDAVAYERFMGRWSRLLAPLLVDFASVRDTGRVLDVGSGTGALAFALAKRKSHCQVLGIDPSQAYVNYATSKNVFGKRVSFDVGDAQQLGRGDSVFDACLSLLVLNFIPDSRKALRELIRVTKPGGVISAAVWDYGSGMRMLRVFWDAAKAVDPSSAVSDESRMPLSREGELANLWNQTGLANVEEKALDITMHFASFADYWNAFLLGQGPAGAYMKNASDKLRQALRSELKRRLSLNSDDAPFTISARAWAVRGSVRK